MAEVRLSKISKSFGIDGRPRRRDHDRPRTALSSSFWGRRGRARPRSCAWCRGWTLRMPGLCSSGGHPMAGLTPAHRNVAMVFQQYSLYPHMNVRENLEFPLKSPMLRTPQAEIDRKVAEVAEILQISHKLDNKATALSGGEMQRVSIGRALVRNPSVYLMDEPLSSLDAKLRADLRVELKNIQANSGATLLYVTHDPGGGHDHGDPDRSSGSGQAGAVRHTA